MKIHQRNVSLQALPVRIVDVAGLVIEMEGVLWRFADAGLRVWSAMRLLRI